MSNYNTPAVNHLLDEKSKMIAKVFLILLWGILFPIARMQGAPPILPGSDCKMEDAAVQADIVLVGKLKKLGLPMPLGGPGVVPHHGSTVEVIRLLKGDASGLLTVSIVVESKPGLEESTPEAGKRYLFFIAKQKSNLLVKKIVTYDEPTLQFVSKAISQSH